MPINPNSRAFVHGPHNEPKRAPERTAEQDARYRAASGRRWTPTPLPRDDDEDGDE